MKHRRLLKAIISIGTALVFLLVINMVVLAENDSVTEEAVVSLESVSGFTDDVAFRVDMVWILIAGFLVFSMQAGFAMLEAGMIRQSGVVNSLAENFFDSTATALVFFAIGFGIAYGDTVGGFFGSSLFFLGGSAGTAGTQEEARLFLDAFYQFCFAAAAATIITGAMAERTNFLAKIAYSVITAMIIYPIVVHWVWQGEGWLTDLGFLDFAGSTVVHQVGGVLALVGAYMVGTRTGVDPKNPPQGHNMALATMGTFILWFGWYGFNVGSTLDASNPNLMALTAVNTTLAAAAGAVAAMSLIFVRTRKWDLTYMLNGSLAGLVAITASCAFVAPTSAVTIGVIGGIIVVVAMDAVRAAGIDDAVGAFSVHGAAGMFGSISVGLFGLEALTGSSAGLLAGGGFDLLIVQIIGVGSVALWTLVTGVIMFSVLKAVGILRIPEHVAEVGIDFHEHGASAWPDVLPLPDMDEMKSGLKSPAPASGD